MKRLASAVFLVGAGLLLPQQPSPAILDSPPRSLNPPVVRHLLDKAATQGLVRVLVTLAVPVRPEGFLTSTERERQRSLIARVQDVLLRELAGSYAAVSRFRMSPGLALDVDRATLQRLASHPLVKSVEEDRQLTPLLAESTPLVGAPAAWASGATGAGTAVAILDTGVDRNHPFLEGRVVSEACFGTSDMRYEPFCPSGSRTAPGSAAPCSMEGCEHGTMVAGIAAGRGGAFQGVAPDASIIAMQIFVRYHFYGEPSKLVAFVSDITLALERVYALRTSFNIAAVNLSVGASESSVVYSAPCDTEGEPLKYNIDHLASVGIATVIGSGNSGSSNGLTWPGCLSSAINVGSTRDGGPGATPPDTVSSFSNSASYLDLLAPGEAIVSSIPGGAFQVGSGTSLAAAHVTGAWALLKQRRPEATVARVLRALNTTGVAVTDPRNGITRPRIDVGAALAAIGTPCSYAIDPSSMSIGYAAASGTIHVTTEPHCDWSVWRNSIDFNVDPTVEQIGPAALGFTVKTNHYGAPRSISGNIAGQPFTLTQEASPCTYSINPREVEIGPGAAEGTVFVSTSDQCQWSATSAERELLFADDTFRSGSGGLHFTVSANDTDGYRVRSSTIAGRTFTVVQSARVVCSYAINPASISIGSTGGDGTIFVTTQAGCSWSAASGVPHLSFADAAGRTGSGALPFTVQPNFSTVTRTGSAVIGGPDGSAAFTMQQAGVPQTGGALRERARADFNGDGFSDLVWRDSLHGYIVIWELQGSHATHNAVSLPLTVNDPDWRIVGTGDFNGDGKPDIVWHHRTDGRVYLWYMDGVTRIGHSGLSEAGIDDPNWQIAGVGDFNGDGKPDLVWQHDTIGWLAVWLMDGATLLGGVDMSPGQVDVEWKIAGVGDLNADGHPDLIWRNSVNGKLGAWLMDGVTRVEFQPIDPEIVDDPAWRIAAVIDIDQNETPDLVWHHSNGWIVVWYMNGTQRTGYGVFPYTVEAPWRIVGPK